MLHRAQQSLSRKVRITATFKMQTQKHNKTFMSLFIFRGHSTREPASTVVSRMVYFILWPGSTQETVFATANTGKNLGEVLEKMQVNGPGG